MPAGRPILVTGSHRSGTTWCGRLISTAAKAYYIHEPFNLHHPPGVCPVDFERWFQHVDDHNAHRYEEALSHPMNLEFALGAQLQASLQGKRQNVGTGVRGGLWGIKEWIRWHYARKNEVRPLIKDPIALFSTEWLARTFEAQVVITVRHPAAFVYSVRRAGWKHDFTNFVDQPVLMDTLLAPYADAIRSAAEEPGDLTDQATLLWNLTHSAIATYRNRHPDWVVVRNEDLATRPMDTYASVFSDLEFSFSDAERNVVRAFTNAESNPDDSENDLFSVRRDSQYEAWKWKHELDSQTIRRVKKKTHSVWPRFYDESEWRRSQLSET